MTDQKTMRAHALMQIKRADQEARRISGIASTPALDRQGDVLDPAGATFKLPFPLLMGHDHGQPIGEVIDARTTPQGIWISAQIAPEGTSDRIDEAWRLIRAGLIKGLSVGFIGRDYEVMKNGGRRFTEWEIIELSAVTVPANQEAEILEVKRLAEAQEKQADESPFPCFPRSLSKADRGLLADGAATKIADGILAKREEIGGKTTGMEKTLLQITALLVVYQRWAMERIEELEGRADGH